METVFFIMFAGFMVWALVIAFVYVSWFIKMALALATIPLTLFVFAFSLFLIVASWFLYPLVLPFSFLVMIFLDLPIKPFKWIFRDKSPAIFKRMAMRYWNGCNSLRKKASKIAALCMSSMGYVLKFLDFLAGPDSQEEYQSADPMLTLMAMQYFKKGK